MVDFFKNLIAQVASDFQNIELVKAAFYASSIGSLIYLLRLLPARLMFWLQRMCLYSITVSNNDPAYAWLQLYVTKEALGKRARRLIVMTQEQLVQDHDYDEQSIKKVSSLRYKPDVGSYLLYYRAYPLLLQTSRERIEQHNSYSESITLTCLFRRALLLELMSEAAQHAKTSEKKAIRLFTGNHHYWQNSGQRPFRSLESLVYAEDINLTLLQDARKFMAEQAWYQAMGIPWRRGYLLYGPPGNGKTSLAFALASELKFDVYTLNLASNLNDDSLQALMASVPEGSIVLLEEVDEAFSGTKKEWGISHTGLLNALDGISSGEGRIVIMTTNYRERISPALIRPGRADLHLYVGNASVDQAAKLFQRFYPASELASDFAQEVKKLGHEVSMAALQNHLLRYRGDAALCIQQVSHDLKPEPALEVTSPAH